MTMATRRARRRRGALIARSLGEEQFARGRHRKRVCLKHLVINRRSESWRAEWVGINGGRRIKVQPLGEGSPKEQMDRFQVADEDGVGGDDAADALRYLVATKARTVSQRKLRGV